MSAKASLVIALLCALAFAHSEARAATLVIGVNTYAQDCYSAARAENPSGLSVCNLALNEPLSLRDRAATFINRSALRILSGDKQGGLADCDASIRTFDGLSEAYLNRGVALQALGQPDAAIIALNKSLELGLSRPQLGYYDRAMAKEDVGDVVGAYRDYKAALQASPEFSLAADQLRRFKVAAGASDGA